MHLIHLSKEVVPLLEALIRLSNVPSELGPFENVFDLADGGIISGKNVVSEFPSKPSWKNRGRKLGHQEARDLLMANQRLPSFDPNLPCKVKDDVRGLKKVKWECMETIVSSLELSPNLLRCVLERSDNVAVEGSTSRHVA
uniref:Uncharacterized protein n=1 Tax=Tanacetum cinerariifolium TaxID=118510 RepID=A0A6L2JVG6_TANCI|nr:hypothetical protein [Tanacetum cinerariifolium]